MFSATSWRLPELVKSSRNTWIGWIDLCLHDLNFTFLRWSFRGRMIRVCITSSSTYVASQISITVIKIIATNHHKYVASEGRVRSFVLAFPPYRNDTSPSIGRAWWLIKKSPFSLLPSHRWSHLQADSGTCNHPSCSLAHLWWLFQWKFHIHPILNWHTPSLLQLQISSALSADRLHQIDSYTTFMIDPYCISLIDMSMISSTGHPTYWLTHIQLFYWLTHF